MALHNETTILNTARSPVVALLASESRAKNKSDRSWVSDHAVFDAEGLQLVLLGPVLFDLGVGLRDLRVEGSDLCSDRAELGVFVVLFRDDSVDAVAV